MCKTYMQKVIKDELNRWSNLSCSWMGKLKDASSPQICMEIICSLIKIPIWGPGQDCLFTWKCKNSGIASWPEEEQAP